LKAFILTVKVFVFPDVRWAVLLKMVSKQGHPDHNFLGAFTIGIMP